MDRLLEFWRAREPRERLILGLGGFAAAAILLFALLAPLFSRVSAAEARLQRKQEDLAWLEAAAPQVLAAGPGAAATPATADNALVIVDRVARESGLGSAVSKVEPAGAGQFQATLREAPFDNVIAWLARLRQQHGISVAGLSINPAAAPGLVNASVQFQIGAR
jgi:general secretion pathway protein M